MVRVCFFAALRYLNPRSLHKAAKTGSDPLLDAGVRNISIWQPVMPKLFRPKVLPKFLLTTKLRIPAFGDIHIARAKQSAYQCTMGKLQWGDQIRNLSLSRPF